ncbi:MAG: hypothetical protein PSX36_02820 [bacterium]|nr:hypothetical protein [bacterium]
MKHFVLFTFATLLASCSSLKKGVDYGAFALTAKEQLLISVKAVLTSKLDETNDPIDEVKEYTVGESVKPIIYLTWFELSTPQKYYVKIKWISPNDELFEQNDYLFTAKEPTWYTWHFITLEDKLAPRGNWKIKIYINNELKKDLKFTLK